MSTTTTATLGTTDRVLRDARQLGAEIGAAAATWADDFSGWSDDDLATFCEDDDPEIMDRFTVPNLSGEWADDPTPNTLADDIGIRRDSRLMDDACSAWEDGCSDAFWAQLNERATAERYSRYVDACETENLEPHPVDAWHVHGRPRGPLG